MSSNRMIETALKGIIAEADKELDTVGQGSVGQVALFSTCFGNPEAYNQLGVDPYTFPSAEAIAIWFGYFELFKQSVKILNWSGMKIIGTYLLNTLPGAVALQPDA